MATTTDTDTAVLVEKARAFRALHVPGRPLVLPNAWDAASAALVAKAGAKAVATTSAGVAWSLGFGDGGHLDRATGIAAIARIAGAVDIPVSADIERGYADDPEGVAETVRGVLAAGVVGVNLEDSLGPVPASAARIAAARRAVDAAGVPLYINARIDVFRMQDPDPEDWFREVVTRAAAYTEAGADGVFLLGALSAETISSVVEAVKVPLNVSVAPGTLPVPALAAAGAARVSAGAAIAESAYAHTARLAKALLTTGSYPEQVETSLNHSQLNSLLLG
ncbi:isocitrate lyase/PEP mutase family protein [Streptacidiphilus fuscans]|uniref:Isocitrate lyase/phosphoenolpyruvate mutase family protein n=1 Tax=Streptacidiphilus fuscans TaxID=2789292 RepID=A0A931B9I4_9ACTN|nr:isocitrate lyase/phosphoenolpyruvate mutase family protein [Streptacidiphilus fuscans]MBF9069360.1 isocitrate lyase/phosphoenolpyruvate mutase family protein [Streptacidiphilus fuscans]